ncbi:MAG: cobalamin biosynthesis protein [Oscillospiraceae bacterium]|nr:cobalamin biosynthesis protein [Oscillospiraceae bacterium]
MKLSLFAFSKTGCDTARLILDNLPEHSGRIYSVERLAEADIMPICRPSSEFYGRCFNESDALIFVSACGIAVRAVAPHIRSKNSDPAVICVDERANYVIPILSGHIGGANALAVKLSEVLGAQAVITTATDINHRISIDAWAEERGFIIDSMASAKAVSAAVLEGDVPFFSEFPVIGEYAPGLIPGNKGPVGVCLGVHVAAPFENSLRLIPPILRIGIGCRRGSSEDAIESAVNAVLENEGIDRRAIKSAASIDLKADEEGLIEYCRKMGWPLSFYTADELRSVSGVFSGSAFVERVTGVDTVCERAALIGAERLIVKKTALNGVTVALAAEHLEVQFG